MCQFTRVTMTLKSVVYVAELFSFLKEIYGNIIYGTALGFFAVGLFAAGQFVVRKKNLTKPNLANLT